MRFKYTPKCLPIPTDYLNGEDTASLDNEAVGALVRLALVATGSPSCNLPDDDAKLSGISRLGARWSKHAKAVRNCLKADPEEPGRLILPLALEERIKYEDWCEGCAKGGKKTQSSKVQVSSDLSSTPSPLLPSSPPSSPPSSLSSNPSPSPPPGRAARREVREGSKTLGGEKKKITAEDLRDDGALLRLYHGAVAKQFLTRSEADRLKYFAAAEHSLAKARPADTAGHLFSAIVMDLNWKVITADEEDRARRRLKKIDGNGGSS